MVFQNKYTFTAEKVAVNVEDVKAFMQDSIMVYFFSLDILNSIYEISI
jgi:hypothetical protein